MNGLSDVRLTLHSQQLLAEHETREVTSPRPALGGGACFATAPAAAAYC